MKRSLFIAIVVLLMAALFISCNAEKSLEDQLVEVTIDGGARALDVSAESVSVNPEGLVWYYTAEKKDSFFTTGQTLEKKAIKADAAAGLAGSLGEFSRGAWLFKFYGYDKALTDTTAKLIYSAESETTVGRTALNLTLTLKAESVGKSDIYVDGVTFDCAQLALDDYTGTRLVIKGFGTTDYPEIDGELNQGTRVYTFSSATPVFSSVDAGTYAVVFEVYGLFGTNEEEKIGEYPTSVTVVDGMKYTISDNVTNPRINAVEPTTAVIIAGADLPATKIQKDTQPLASTAVTFETSNTPKADTDAKTTVTFSAGTTFDTTATDATLTVTTYNSAAAATTPAFQIAGSDNNAIAGISLTLSSGFEGNVTVNTFIGKDLPEPLTVVYTGTTGSQPTNVSYNSTTGYISFVTTHFSDFAVYQAEAKIGSTLYATVNDAVNAAQAGETVVLLKDVGLSATVSISKNITIDLNGKNIAAVGTRALWVKAGDVTITGNGTISSAAGGNFQSTSSVIRIGDGTNTVAANLTIGASVIVSSDFCYGITIFGGNVGVDAEGQSLVLNGKILVTGTQPAISGNGNATNSKTVITLNDGAVVSASQDYAIYHPQAGTLTVHGATITGLGGVELKAGSTAVIDEDAIVRATGVASHSKNNDGTSTSGYAIAAVENSGYKGNPVVTISNGSFYGPVAILEDDAVEAGKKASITISGGAFDNPSAFDYLADGASIKLLGNIELNSPVFITKSVTIDGDGNAIISNQSIKTYADVTFKNLTYRYPSNSANNASMVYGDEGTKNLVFDNCIFENPQWEVIQYTSNQQESLVVKNCVFRANDIHGATSDYGNAADQAIRYIHIQPAKESNVSGVSIEITNNRFAECDKVYDSICGLYYVEGTIKIGGNTFENWATGDVVEGKTAKLSVHWLENESLKEVAKWTGEIATYTI